MSCCLKVEKFEPAVGGARPPVEHGNANLFSRIRSGLSFLGFYFLLKVGMWLGWSDDAEIGPSEKARFLAEDKEGSKRLP
jgi:hypothetical protein